MVTLSYPSKCRRVISIIFLNRQVWLRYLTLTKVSPVNLKYLLHDEARPRFFRERASSFI